MLGYYENFSDFLQLKYGKTFKYNAVLVFRNDKDPFKEILNTDMDDSILNISVSPSKETNLNINQFKELCRHLLEVCGKEGNIAEVIGEYRKDVEAKKQSIYEIIKSNNEELIEEVILDISNNNHKIISNIFNVPELQQQLDITRLKLERDHFPHIWEKLHDNTRTILSMAENLFMNIKDSKDADYAPICLEYCRAIEYELNNSLIRKFREKHNITNLINKSNYYKKLIEDRDLTLGEIIFLISKCNVKNKFSTIELKNHIEKNIKGYYYLLNKGTDDLDDINKGFRRRAAHTSIISYKDLIECRQRVLGIGYQNLFYILFGLMSIW